jgi:hypothetical protein
LELTKKSYKSIKAFIVLLFLVFTIDAFCNDTTVIQKPVAVEKGTTIKVQSTNTLKSNKISEGDQLEFKVFEDLVIKGATVVKAGTTVNAYVESVEKSRALGKEGYIRLQFVNTRGVDSTLIPIRAINSSISGENTLNTTIVLSALINPLFLFKNGKQAKLKEGKVMFVYITKDLTIMVN